MKKVCGAIFRISDAHPLNKCVLPINHTGPHTTVKTPTAMFDGFNAQADRGSVQTALPLVQKFMDFFEAQYALRGLAFDFDELQNIRAVALDSFSAFWRVYEQMAHFKSSTPLSAEELAELMEKAEIVKSYYSLTLAKLLIALPGVAVVRNKSEEPTNELSKWIKVVPKGNELERLKQVERDYKALLTAIDIVHEGHYGAAMNAVLEDYPKLRYIYLGGKK